MTFDGLMVEGRREAGSRLITHFAFRPGQEEAAGRELLACFADGAEVGLRNDPDEGGEGLSTFRCSTSGLVSMINGHGWQSAWKPIDESGFLRAVAGLACHNRGGPFGQGSIIRDTGPAERNRHGGPGPP
jgi:hypothetical protein